MSFCLQMLSMLPHATQSMLPILLQVLPILLQVLDSAEIYGLLHMLAVEIILESFSLNFATQAMLFLKIGQENDLIDNFHIYHF